MAAVAARKNPAEPVVSTRELGASGDARSTSPGDNRGNPE
jgi:hypothetical protein